MVSVALIISVFLIVGVDVACSWAASDKQAGSRPSKLNPSIWLGRARNHRTGTVEDKCSSDYGDGYIARWQRLYGYFCSGGIHNLAGKGAAVAVGTQIECYAHPSVDLSTCLAQNLVFNSTALLGPPSSSSLPNPFPGSIKVSCKANLNKKFLRGRLQNEGMRKVLIDALGQTNFAEIDQACSATGAVQHAVLLTLQRDTSNPFHHLEYVVSFFAALATLDVPAALLEEGLEASSQQLAASSSSSSSEIKYILAHEAAHLNGTGKCTFTL